MTHSYWPVICLFLLFLQGSMLSFWWPGVHLPDLWLVTIMLLTFLDGPRLGMAVALVGAVAQDIIVGNYFGLHLVGYAVAILLTIPAWRHLQVRYSMVFMVVFLGSVLAGMATYALLFITGETMTFIPYMLQVVLPSAAINTIFSMVLYPLLRQRKGDI